MRACTRVSWLLLASRPFPRSSRAKSSHEGRARGHSTHNANGQLAVCSKLGPWPQLGIGNRIKVLNWHWVGIETTEGKPRLNLQSQPPSQIPTVNCALGFRGGG